MMNLPSLPKWAISSRRRVNYSPSIGQSTCTGMACTWSIHDLALPLRESNFRKSRSVVDSDLAESIFIKDVIALIEKIP